STYQTGRRSTSWLKIKTEQRQEAVIGGFTDPGGGRKYFGALLLGVYQGKQLFYVGHVGTGFSEKLLRDIHRVLEPLVQSAGPFKVKPPSNAPAHWVKPERVCEVNFREWTKDGVMRQPVFLGMRSDVAPESVQRERAEATPRDVSSDADRLPANNEPEE